MTVLEILSAMTAWLDSMGLLQFLQAAIIAVIGIVIIGGIRRINQ